MTTDNEQDLLRSMLVMAAGGIDATVKQLIQDNVSKLLGCDAKAKNSFEKFVLRKLQAEAAVGTPKLLAAALASPEPYQRLIGEYVDQLTAGSLQSVDSLFEVAAALGADPTEIGLLPNELKPIFDTRNKIIHELDINLSAVRRTRTVRRQGDMIRSTERLFRFAHALIASVDNRLPAVGN